MRDTDLYGRILGIESPWEVTGVELRLEAGEVEVFVARGSGESYRCPECGGSASRHDSRRRRWRHLPTCQYRTILTAEVPRVRCSEHGVLTIGVPWSDAGSRFTALFEALVIDWLGEASMSAVARRLDLKDALSSYYESLSKSERSEIETVAMDMWPAYISATVSCLPDGDQKIAYDKFHVAAHLGDAVDEVRREEHRFLCSQGDGSLADTRYLWLYHPDRVPERCPGSASRS